MIRITQTESDIPVMEVEIDDKPAEQIFVELVLESIGKVRSVNTKRQYILAKAELVRVNATSKMNQLNRELIEMDNFDPRVRSHIEEINKVQEILAGIHNVPYAVKRIFG